ncbi:EamA family transporter [Halobium salinum]|uniref:EamA family transporter n=1 Tax=Halobium salinum TaxID=1364940 RepID=A0ABD5PF82_9EURY|nr:EamA family transporter [Halobium salinum]
MDGLLAGPPVVYLLALLPALLWGFSPVFSKRGMAAGGDAVEAALVVVVVDSALYWAALAVRGGGLPFSGLTPVAVGIFALAGVFGTALGRIAVFNGVDRVGASVNSAVISARPLFATLLAAGFLGEAVGPATLLGVLVLVVGLAALTLSKGGDVEGWRPRDLLFPVAAAVVFAVGNVLRRYGLQAFDTTPLEAVALNETAALVVLSAYLLARDPDRVRGWFGRDSIGLPDRSTRYFAASGTLTAVALLSLFAALNHPQGTVAVVDPLAATAPLFTAVFAYFLLGDLESVTRGVVVGAALVVVGVALVTVQPDLGALVV